MKYDKKVSICMMVKDEAKNLNRCLSSLKPIINTGLAELIVIDTGSKDNSIEIAKQYTDKVFQHEWTNNFSEMRNISISYAKGEWIWIIDADEEIEDPEYMINVFKSDLSKYNTIIVKIRNYMKSDSLNDEDTFNICVLNRGFRNNGFYYTGSIHEQPLDKAPFLDSGIVIAHYGYIWEDKEFRQRKFERTTRILEEELKKNPNNIYYRFQLAVSWAVVNYEEGLTRMREAYNLVKKLSVKERPKFSYINGIYAKIAYANKKYMEIIDICKEGLELNKDYIDLWYFNGLANIALGNENEALRSFKEFLKCKKRFNKTQISKDPAFTFYCLDENSEQSALYNISVIYINRKQYDSASEYMNEMNVSDLKSRVVSRLAYEDKMQDKVIEYFKQLESEIGLRRNFIKMLENNKVDAEKKVKMSKQIVEYYDLNKKQIDSYYLLNQVRISFSDKRKLDDTEIDQIISLNYEELEDYYADIIMYIVENHFSLNLLIEKTSLSKLDEFMKYISMQSGSNYENIAIYLNRNSNIDNLVYLRYWILMAKYTLLSEKVSENEYIDLFEKYVAMGIEYIQYIYNPNVLEEENIYDISNEEHKFFLYFLKANEVRAKDKKAYIQYLRKALGAQPMKKGIELCLEKIKEEKQAINSSKDSEFEQYKKIVKDNINILIEANQIAEAKAIIDEYLKIVPNDLEMLMLKSEIQVRIM